MNKQETKEINLLVKTKGLLLSTPQIKKLLTISSILIMFILAATSIELFIIGRIFETQANELLKNIKVSESDIQTMKNKEILVREINDKLTVAQKLMGSGSKVVFLFDQFRSLLSPDISIDSLDLSESQLSTSISTGSLFSLESFLQNIADPQKGGKFLIEVVAPSINVDPKGLYTANITAKIKPGL